MNIIKTYKEFLKIEESYLKGGRQPLYTWIYDIKKLIKTDSLNRGNPALDKNNIDSEEPGQLKSISLTRSSNFIYHGGYRLMLDVDKLINNGYKPQPFDEFSTAYNSSPNPDKKSSKHRHYKTGLKHILHNTSISMNPLKRAQNGEEFEERIYRDITNLGKYIIYFDVMPNIGLPKDMLTEYIKKYPHIKVRRLETFKAKLGNEVETFSTDRGKVILDINIIKDEEKQVKNLTSQY